MASSVSQITITNGKFCVYYNEVSTVLLPLYETHIVKTINTRLTAIIPQQWYSCIYIYYKYIHILLYIYKIFNDDKEGWLKTQLYIHQYPIA